MSGHREMLDTPLARLCQLPPWRKTTVFVRFLQKDRSVHVCMFGFIFEVLQSWPIYLVSADSGSGCIQISRLSYRLLSRVSHQVLQSWPIYLVSADSGSGCIQISRLSYRFLVSHQVLQSWPIYLVSADSGSGCIQISRLSYRLLSRASSSFTVLTYIFGLSWLRFWLYSDIQVILPLAFSCLIKFYSLDLYIQSRLTQVLVVFRYPGYLTACFLVPPLEGFPYCLISS